MGLAKIHINPHQDHRSLVDHLSFRLNNNFKECVRLSERLYLQVYEFFYYQINKELFIIKLSMESKWVAIVREEFDEEEGSLYLNGKEINDNDIPDIIEACRGVNNQIKGLNLHRNIIGAEGSKYLSTAKFPNLTMLILGQNNIGAEGLKYLSAANFPNLTLLYLGNNNIGAEGAKYLSAAKFPNLKELGLKSNNIKQPNKTYLRLLFEQKNIKYVYL